MHCVYSTSTLAGSTEGFNVLNLIDIDNSEITPTFMKIKSGELCSFTSLRLRRGANILLSLAYAAKGTILLYVVLSLCHCTRTGYNIRTLRRNPSTPLGKKGMVSNYKAATTIPQPNHKVRSRMCVHACKWMLEDVGGGPKTKRNPCTKNIILTSVRRISRLGL